MDKANCYKGCKMPHKPTENTREIVQGMYAAGISQDRIAAYLDISDETLRKYYRDEMDKAFDTTTTSIVKVLIEKALAGNDKSIAFYLTHRCGWKPASDKDNDGSAQVVLDMLAKAASSNAKS